MTRARRGRSRLSNRAKRLLALDDARTKRFRALSAKHQTKQQPEAVRDLSDALSAVQRDQDVTGLDALAGSLTTLGGAYAFHGRLLLKALEPTPRQYPSIIWSLVQVLDKLERGGA